MFLIPGAVCFAALFALPGGRAITPAHSMGMEAIGTNNPPATPPPASSTKSKSSGKHVRAKRKKTTALPEWFAAYHVAYVAIHDHAEYVDGIAQLHAIGHDEDSDIATLIGYANRKMGRYDDARSWYDRALAANPNNARTLSYYGMWHAEQGNLIKANEYLVRVRSLCGNSSCREYAELKAAIAGTKTY
jgi:tetratricopeptide (TPR) repeat protein